MDFMADFCLLSKQSVYPILTMADKKCIIKQLTQGIKYLHDNWVLHRDIKPDNIFINEKGEIVISDLGIARNFGSPERKMSTKIVTINYRPPEILFQSQLYGKGVDIWSLGCVIAEILMNGRKLFTGDSEIN